VTVPVAQASERNLDSVSEAKPMAARLIALLDTLTWWRIVLLSSAAAVVVGGWVFAALPARYTASATLLVSHRPDVIASFTQSGEVPLGDGALTNLLTGEPAWLKRLELILRSRRIAMHLVRKCKLAERSNADEDGAASALLKTTRIKLLEKAGVAIQVTCCGPSRLQECRGRRPSLSHDEARRLCAELANEYAVALDKYATEVSVGAARQTRQFIEKRQRQLEQDLAHTEDRLEALQTTHTLIEPQNKAVELVELTKEAARSYASAAAECEELAHSLQAARGRLAEEDAMRIAEEVTARNPVIAALEEKLAELRVQLATELESGKAPSHPDLLDLQAAIDSTEHQLDELAEEVRQQVSRHANPAYDAIMSKVVALEVALSGVQARKAMHHAQLAQAREQIVGFPPVVREYVTLARERQLQSELLTTLARRLELAAIEEQRESTARLDVLDAAVPPRAKSGPSSVRSAELTFAVVAIVLSLAVAHRRGLLVPRLLE